jgi:DNA-binding transcriptional LysR family regulator
VPVSGSLVLNDMYLVLNAVLDGIGIGYIAEHVISPRVADGRLVPLLGDWCGISRELICFIRAVATCQARCVHLSISCAPNPTSSTPLASKNRSMNRS